MTSRSLDTWMPSWSSAPVPRDRCMLASSCSLSTREDNLRRSTRSSDITQLVAVCLIVITLMLSSISRTCLLIPMSSPPSRSLL